LKSDFYNIKKYKVETLINTIKKLKVGTLKKPKKTLKKHKVLILRNTKVETGREKWWV
jgi:pimeloyl-CoA synthetase